MEAAPPSDSSLPTAPSRQLPIPTAPFTQQRLTSISSSDSSSFSTAPSRPTAPSVHRQLLPTASSVSPFRQLPSPTAPSFPNCFHFPNWIQLPPNCSLDSSFPRDSFPTARQKLSLLPTADRQSLSCPPPDSSLPTASPFTRQLPIPAAPFTTTTLDVFSQLFPPESSPLSTAPSRQLLTSALPLPPFRQLPSPTAPSSQLPRSSLAPSLPVAPSRPQLLPSRQLPDSWTGALPVDS